MARIEIERVQGYYGFEGTDQSGNSLRMDSSKAHGGNEAGVRPMQLLLMALGGCSGIDIVSILKKQRQELKGLRMVIEGEREQGKEPALWKDIRVIFELHGDIDADKARKACALSMDKYCSVAETLRRAGADITWEYKIINTL